MTMKLMSKGSNASIPPGITDIFVGLGWEAPPPVAGMTSYPYDLDPWLFMLGANRKVLSDDHFVFFNNRVSPCGSVKVSEDNQEGGTKEGDDETVDVNLATIPEDIQTIVFIVNIHQAKLRKQNFGQLDNAHIRIYTRDAAGNEIVLAHFNLGEDDAGTETSLMFGELYRHKGSWKFRAIAQGRKEGPAKLAQEFGVDVTDDPEPEDEPADTTAPPEPPKLDMVKGSITLSKPGTSILMRRTGEMEFSLYWTAGRKDLGLILLVTYRDGTQRAFDWRQLRDELGEIWHHGDVRKGGKNTREYVTIRLRPDTQIAAIAIVAYSELANGIGSFKSMGTHAVIDDGEGNNVSVDLNKGGTFSYHVLICTIIVLSDGNLEVIRTSRFSAAGSERRPVLEPGGTVKMNKGETVFKSRW